MKLSHISLIGILVTLFLIPVAFSHAQTATIDLAWEAHTYTPPFFKGKAMFSYQGEVTVGVLPVATAQGVLNPKNLTYTWSKDGTVFGGQSGIGKESITFVGSVIARPMRISVKVSSFGEVIGEGSVTISPQSPQLLMYIDNPLYGVLYNTALPNSITLNQNEVRLVAAPYFFTSSAPHNASTPQFDWKINSNPVSTTNNGRPTLTLRKPDNTSGQSQISVKASSVAELLQFTETGVVVNY